MRLGIGAGCEMGSVGREGEGKDVGATRGYGKELLPGFDIKNSNLASPSPRRHAATIRRESDGFQRLAPIERLHVARAEEPQPAPFPVPHRRGTLVEQCQGMVKGVLVDLGGSQ